MFEPKPVVFNIFQVATRKGHSLPFARNKLVQIFAGALYQFSADLENKPK